MKMPQKGTIDNEFKLCILCICVLPLLSILSRQRANTASPLLNDGEASARSGCRLQEQQQGKEATLAILRERSDAPVLETTSSHSLRQSKKKSLSTYSIHMHVLQHDPIAHKESSIVAC